MLSRTYNDMFEEIQKITALSETVPAEFKNRVFKVLLDSLTSNDVHTPYEEQILSLTDNGVLLKEFINRKNPQSNIERTFLFVFYLEKILKFEKIVIEYIETCYNLTGLEMPKSLSQNLRDIVSRYSYLKSERGGYKIDEEGYELYYKKFKDKNEDMI